MHLAALTCTDGKSSKTLQSLDSLEIAKDPKHSLRAFLLARVAGFEPAHDGIRIHCLTAWRYPNAYLYCLTCLQMGWIVGFEPTHNGATTRCLNHLTIPTILEATPGFEPGNKGFADLCLTTWLCRLKELAPLNKNWRSGTGSNRRPPA